MNATLKITKIGNSAGVVLPKDVLARLRVGPGDTLHLTEAPDGVRLTAADPEFAAQMEVAERIMRRDRNILRALAKYQDAHSAETNRPCGPASLAPLPLAGGVGGGRVTERLEPVW